MPLQKRVIKNIPKTEAEILNSQIEPSYGDKPPIHEYKRAEDVSMRGEDLKDISVGLEDIDSAILYYFQDVIRPYVINEGSKQNIPIIFADAERWKTAQKDGVYRDKDGRIMLPIITIRRDNLERNRSISHKLDGNTVNIFQTYEKRYTTKNQYDNFSVLTNRVPVKEFYNVVVPDYYTLTYTCVIYTSFYEDINKIIEDISFRADSYWGEPGKFLFKARIDSFPITNEINDGVDRRFLSSFNLIMNGYLTPSNIGKHLAANALKYRSKSQLLFTMEASSQDVEQVTFKAAVKPKKALTSYIPEGVNVTNINSITNIFSGSLDNSTVVYLNTSETKKADAGSMTSDTATFLNTSFKQPPSGSGLPPTSVSDFKFFVNGIYVDNTYVVTFLESGSNTVLTVNTGSLGYILDNQDDVVAVGKFQ
jgi:hypothetical protein